ncbi:MAG: hypothetical protein ACYC2E_07140 [Sulfuricella sp.]
MKGFNVSMIPSLRAFANRFLARQIKTTAQGRVIAPSTHPRLIVESNSLDISNLNTIAADSAGIASILH